MSSRMTCVLDLGDIRSSRDCDSSISTSSSLRIFAGIHGLLKRVEWCECVANVCSGVETNGLLTDGLMWGQATRINTDIFVKIVLAHFLFDTCQIEPDITWRVGKTGSIDILRPLFEIFVLNTHFFEEIQYHSMWNFTLPIYSTKGGFQPRQCDINTQRHST